ncbi:phosphoribosylaminoimidazole carboxylase ATPase subunit [Candidatus Scalindua japonica]|uniref:Phosphoribosylaminoimidazole carboxylase ATPase subunit n=1 Tax=Candidatus Scalindua japonica TaxID=1284222 RepID=A0A286TUR0_9BACT|nr:cupin domain-containing protein [Candidatus Scalindua japonica]GAX59627.1 phosphoribosylaminoimidazole carboxylase ATPase subunit [Candidatus Scalindua japonica]
MNVSNVFSGIQKQMPEEIIETIVQSHQIKIERIISRSHSTSEGEWYDQGRNEWVLILKGNAGLLFEGNDQTVIMKTGDYLNIPAHRKHRVEWTCPEGETIWLAVHY